MAIDSKAGFWADNYSPKVNRSPKRRQLRRLVQPLGSQKDAEKFETLSGAAVGGATSRTVKQVKHNEAPGTFPNQGVVETRTIESGTTAAADETALDTIFSANSMHRPSTYASDLSGNGGGSKLQGS